MNGTLYGEAFVAVATAMKAAYPHVLLGAVGGTVAATSDDGLLLASASLGDGGSGGGGALAVGAEELGAEQLGVVMASWMADVLAVPGAAAAADFVDVNRYFWTDAATPTDAELLEQIDELPAMSRGVADAFADVGIAAADVPPLLLGEFNLKKQAGGCGALLQVRGLVDGRVRLRRDTHIRTMTRKV